MAGTQPIKLCACGCGEVVRSRKASARYRRGHRARSQFGTALMRFWRKVVKTDGCWIWSGAPVTDFGYGEIYVNGESISAHRYSWQLHCGDIPGGLCVLHRCDNPACVNPGHLFLGTQLDNMADRDRKGRQAKGESHPLHKLSSGDVAAIRAARSDGVMVNDLACRYSVSQSAIYYILQGKRWKE